MLTFNFVEIMVNRNGNTIHNIIMRVNSRKCEYWSLLSFRCSCTQCCSRSVDYGQDSVLFEIFHPHPPAFSRAGSLWFHCLASSSLLSLPAFYMSAWKAYHSLGGEKSFHAQSAWVAKTLPQQGLEPLSRRKSSSQSTAAQFAACSTLTEPY